ncbi:stress responsive A/B barrel domain-containing protein [Hygrophoropsis aurantiaca]|uniref:Stress responsive A/B barrel domain-containing protein n=1 Tax=Hygrophoropsis aurantiaca TaxID=72124 RepID=A0ACB8AML4_9AGAM|nr:stress responsive A/B barrel domain-containing protein [Hygrophoropsis aurantiaca]
MIHHIVLLKYKPEVTVDDIQEVKTRLAALPSQIPAISSLITGAAVSNPLDRGFGEGIIFVFEDEEALNVYRPHKAHTDYQQFVSQFITDITIFDIKV